MGMPTSERRDAARVAHCIALTLLAPSLAGAGSFVAFESGPVRPLAMTPDGLHLYAVNTPDNRLEIFNVGTGGLTHSASVPVGMEPVAVAVRGNNEAWVVNHLSDSLSIVRLSPSAPARVVRTLTVGDEPRDIVFAGPGANRAFITTANRHLPRDPANPERNADVWVFDATNLGDSAAGGTPLAVVNLPADVPRALAVSPDKATVYAAVFNSGNRTTVVSGNVVNGNLPPPLTNVDGVPVPRVGLIIHFDGTDWVDAAGRPWTATQAFTLPDEDVFAIDATSSPPQRLAAYSGVGTVLFNMVANPATGALYVSNLEELNQERFEGPGIFAGSTLRGHFAENRITVIDENGVHPRHLNKHIDYNVFPGTPEENAKSLALPLQMIVSADGSELYVAAYGSSKIGVFDVAQLENDTFVPDEADQIELGGGGPGGLVLDEAHNKLYVLTRFDDSLAIVDLTTRTEQARLPLYNPEPASLVNGRHFLYDARNASSRGDSACASCHIFADTDGISWDLGNPDDPVLQNPNPFFQIAPGSDISFHPMKGPMMTQSLRGLAHDGPMHWRGDRTGGLTGGDPLDEVAAFVAFNAAFEALLGRTAPLTDEEMHGFADYVLQLTYPPNPIRALDNSLTDAQQRGRNYFFNFSPRTTCQQCHRLDAALGFFGTEGQSAKTIAFPFALKIPHLRNLYTKEGMTSQVGPSQGPQIRGFGFAHDGSSDTIFEFLRDSPFNFPGGDAQRLDVGAFLLAFDSDMAPIVGHQVTVMTSNIVAARDVVRLMVARARVVSPVPECELIVKGVLNGVDRGWLRQSDGLFHSDRVSEPGVTLSALLQQVTIPKQERTFTCVPPGSGVRMGIDRDEDGYADRDELDAGTDPADPSDTPQEVTDPVWVPLDSSSNLRGGLLDPERLDVDELA
jgi:YVTN family beta-propeller protein